jgi:hypothetical protein
VQDAPIFGVGLSNDRALRSESLKDTGNRTAIKMEHSSLFGWRDARQRPDYPHRKTLRSGDAERAFHAFRLDLPHMLNAPDDAHESPCVIEQDDLSRSTLSQRWQPQHPPARNRSDISISDEVHERG